MANFFKIMWKTGLKILLLFVLIWLLFFIINFIYPNFFKSLKVKNSYPGENIERQESIPLRFKIYNLFFKDAIKNPLRLSNLSSSTKDSIEMPKNLPYVWGYGSSTFIRDKNKLNMEDYYIFPNKDGSPAQNFKIDGVLVKEKGINNLNKDSIITGEIDTNYLISYYFNIDIYDSKGDYLYSFLGNGYRDFKKDENILNITGMSDKNYDYSISGYKGDGFMVIWSDNNQIENILFTKIKIN